MSNRFRMCRLTVICGNVSKLLFDLNLNGVVLCNVSRNDDITVTFCIKQSQIHFARDLIEQTGGRIEDSIPAMSNIMIVGVIRRPVMFLGCLLLILLTLYLPSRILFVTVSGNERISRQQIMSAADEGGLHFGMKRQLLRSEKVKNNLLSTLPELKWVGVNTSGCVANISVRERAVVDMKNENVVISSIVANYDGVIREITARNGEVLCRVGQAVTKGQLLVSGYADCGRCVYMTGADAEIYAQTRRSLCLFSIPDGSKRGHVQIQRYKIGVLVGKKRINFYKGSGIFDTTCVRMYREYPLVLPGGFQLPIAVTVQQETNYYLQGIQEDWIEAETFLKSFSKDYLLSQMNAGKIISEEYVSMEFESCSHLIGQYICDEMIGQTRSEEIVKNYEQTD